MQQQHRHPQKSQLGPKKPIKAKKRQEKGQKNDQLTLLDKQITGHIEHPRVQQQHKHPQKSHLTLIGKFFRKVTLTRVTVALNSSGATRA